MVVTSGDIIRDYMPIGDSVFTDLVDAGAIHDTELNVEAAQSTAAMAEFEWLSEPAVWHYAAIRVMDLTVEDVKNMPKPQARELFHVMQDVSFHVKETATTGRHQR